MTCNSNITAKHNIAFNKHVYPSNCANDDLHPGECDISITKLAKLIIK